MAALPQKIEGSTPEDKKAWRIQAAKMAYCKNLIMQIGKWNDKEEL
jgi:hypothetical protein